MELQISDLVESIRKEGIEKANEESNRIISQANAKADEIIAAAREKAAKLLEEANRNIEIFKESARIGAEQAKRDAVLSFKNEVQSIIGKILCKDIAKSMNSPEALGRLIASCVASEDVSKLTVEIAQVNDSLKAQLKKEIEGGLVLRPVKDVKAGFRIRSNDGFIDCSDEEIASILAPFLGNMDI